MIPFVLRITGDGIVNLQPLNDELEAVNVVEDGVLVDVVDGFDVLSDQRGDLLTCAWITRLVLLHVIP